MSHRDRHNAGRRELLRQALEDLIDDGLVDVLDDGDGPRLYPNERGLEQLKRWR